MASQGSVLLMTLLGPATCLISKSTIYVSTPLNWMDAQSYCRNNYVDLSSTLSAAELSQMAKDLGPAVAILGWIGLSKTPIQTSYTQWSDGYWLNFTSWSLGEPADVPLEHCITTLSSKWIDHFCVVTIPFFCYKWDPAIVLVEEKKTWEEALEHCRTDYTDLISLSTDTDMQAIRNLTIWMSHVWVGLHFFDSVWLWVNEAPIGSFVSVSQCPVKPFTCGAKKTGSEFVENIDCNMKIPFLCYHK